MGRNANLLAALIAGAGLLAGFVAGAAHGQPTAEQRCQQPGRWIAPGSGDPLGHDRVVARAAEAQVVLLGEDHSRAEDHRWQLAALAAIHGRRPDLVVGFEMFSRQAQPQLDRWIGGEFGIEAFLDAVNWQQTWGYDAEFYLPLFHFARQHRVPMVALNVDRQLVARVARDGWNGVPVEAREGIATPSPASEAYRRSLAAVYRMKQQPHKEDGGESHGPAAASEADLEAILSDPSFQRFVEAQLTWDRAMAEAIAAAAERPANPLVVGILGRGHAEHRWGVPAQLRDLGLERVMVLLPVTANEACDELPEGLADAAFVVGSMEESVPTRPRLGVMIEPSENGVRIVRVLPDSVAAAAEIEADDVIVSAAGRAIRNPQDLVSIVARQAPGTWLPLVVLRKGESLERIARFPNRAEPGK
jgi:uncharacterized iron-regulated protein